MLTAANRRLGVRRIWGFGLPSRDTCPGRSDLCSRVCYSAHLESYRTAVRQRYRANLALSRRPDFARRVLELLTRQRVHVLRVHTGGDFYDPVYARKWLHVMRRAPHVRFFFYTRCWRVPSIRRVLLRMASLPNVRAWFSCDANTGLPARVPRRVRLAWLMSRPGQLPPHADVVFRTRPLRGTVHRRVGLALVCPTENGVGTHTDCARCGHCWH
jgi:hypothetical protein